MHSICFRLLLLSILILPVQSYATPINLLVPAYANPCCDGGPDMWSNLISAAANPDLQVSLIFNPASGPGTTTDPNFINAEGNGPLVDFRNAGGRVFGYVATTYGARLQTDVFSDVDKYYDTLYTGLIDGIFFDEMSNDLANTGYYQGLRNYVRSKGNSELVIGNPGTSYTGNPSGQTAFTLADYVQSADVLMTFESRAEDYLNNYTAPAWVDDFGSDRFAHVIHSLNSWDSNLVDLAISRKAGYVYFTDDQMPNPYDQPTGFWDQEVSDLATANTIATPVPAAIWLLLTGLIVMIPVSKRKAI